MLTECHTQFHLLTSQTNLGLIRGQVKQYQRDLFRTETDGNEPLTIQKEKLNFAKMDNFVFP